MKLTAAIPVVHSGPDHTSLLADLKVQGVDHVLFLSTWDGKNAARADNGQNQSWKVFLESTPETTIKRTHPDFIVEAALSESHGDWTFIFYPGEKLTLNGKTIRQ